MPKGIKGFLKKYRPWNKDKQLSDDHRQKLSESHKGINTWMAQKLGQNSNCWNGGTEKWWKNQAKIRDDYTCQICGVREPAIMQADHIKPKGRFPELGREINNLITLCPNCHARKTVREHVVQTWTAQLTNSGEISDSPVTIFMSALKNPFPGV